MVKYAAQRFTADVSKPYLKCGGDYIDASSNVYLTILSYDGEENKETTFLHLCHCLIVDGLSSVSLKEFHFVSNGRVS